MQMGENPLNMILVVPFTGPDAASERLVSSLKELGGLGNHRLIVASDPRNSAAAAEFASSLEPLFRSVSNELVPVEGASLTRMFRSGLLAAVNLELSAAEAPNPPVLWVEPGFRPAKKGWADAIASEFYSSGNGVRVMGNFRRCPDTRVGVRPGSPGAGVVVPGGVETVGPTVFPASWIRSSGTVKSINNLSPNWRDMFQYELESVHQHSEVFGEVFTDVVPQPVPQPKREVRVRVPDPSCDPQLQPAETE